MTDYVWPADIVPFAQSFYPQPHTGGTESPFSLVTKTYGLSASRFISRMSLRAPESADRWSGSIEEWGERIDAFLAKVRGRENRVILWDFRREGSIPATAANQEINVGDSVIHLTGATPSNFRVGQYVGGDGRPHVITGISPGGGSTSTDLSLTVEPPFQAYVAAGAAEFFRVAGTFRLTSDDSASNMSTVGELTPYDLEFAEDVSDPSVSLYDTFADTAGVKPTTRDAQQRRLYGRGPVPGRWRTLGFGIWGTDGNGYVYPTQISSLLPGASLLAPAGTSGDRKITVVLNSTTNFRPGIIIATNGRYFITFEYTNIGNGVRIREGDLHSAYPTYDSSVNSFTNIGTGTFSSYVAADDQTFTAEISGTTVTVTHVNSGTVVTGTTTVPIGPESGFYSNSASAKFKSFKVEPVGTPSFFDIGNSVKLIDARAIEFLGDADGISLAFRADGLPFLALGNSSNQNGTIGGIYTASQGAPGLWAVEAKDINSGIALTDRYTGVEGVCLIPLSDYRYLFVHDTPAGGQFILDLETGARTQLSAYTNGQDCRILTIDGEMCILSTHQGGTGATGIAHGGVVGRRYLGGDPMSLASWQEFTIVERPGAWAFQKSNFGFVDLDGDTVADEIAFGVRDNDANADVTAPGLYSVKKPATPFTTPWTETARYLPGNGVDFLNWDFGNFSGDGNGLDAVFVILNEVAAPKIWRKSTGTVSTAITLGLGALNTAFNIMKMPTRGTGTRDGFLVWVQYMGFVHVYWDGAAWQKKVVRGERATHGWNACNGANWARPDGSYSTFIGDSFGNALLDMRFK